MRQVLFRIPHLDIPIYGFGMMLFIVFIATTWLTGRRAQKEGIRKEYLQDLAIWIFVGGLIGARTVFMIQYHEPIDRFFMIWQGGLVFYGSAIGGVVGYALAYVFVIRKHGLSSWKLADVIFPAVALGLCLGRIGCFLNGCCYGQVACEHCPAVHFPLSSPARFALVEKGLQTAAGFTMTDKDDDDPRRVSAVAPASPAYESGLRPGDVIVKAGDQQVSPAIYVITEDDAKLTKQTWGAARSAVAKLHQEGRKTAQVFDDLSDYLTRHWPRGKTDLALTVRREGREIELPAFSPRTLGLHPTQLYESISMVFLFLLLTAYYPLRRHDGEVMVLFILGYSVHRFLNEMLRNDTDPVAFGMTLSQNGSILFFVIGTVLLAYLRRNDYRRWSPRHHFQDKAIPARNPA
jgi:prolipoprotein diacylglyceryltransferase